MIKINAKSENSTIEILGQIGESWFEEGATLNNIKSQIDEISSKKITVKISSLGGDAFEGLAIHDIFKASKKKINVEIIGATASAGTIVAMGGDNIKIAENALFLVHNAWTQAQGNATDLRKTAESLELVDGRMVAIYKTKTNKEESEIKSLMNEDKWIDANEALDFGFVNSISQPAKIAASVYEQINNSELPKIKININKNEEMTEETKSFFASKFDEIMANFKKPEAVEPIAKEETISKTEFDEKLNEVNALIESVNTSNEELKAQLEAKEQEAKDLNKALANAKAVKIEANAEGVAPDAEGNQTNEFNAAMNSIKALTNSKRLR